MYTDESTLIPMAAWLLTSNRYHFFSIAIHLQKLPGFIHRALDMGMNINMVPSICGLHIGSLKLPCFIAWKGKATRRSVISSELSQAVIDSDRSAMAEHAL